MKRPFLTIDLVPYSSVIPHSDSGGERERGGGGGGGGGKSVSLTGNLTPDALRQSVLGLRARTMAVGLGLGCKNWAEFHVQRNEEV